MCVGREGREAEAKAVGTENGKSVLKGNCKEGNSCIICTQEQHCLCGWDRIVLQSQDVL